MRRARPRRPRPRRSPRLPEGGTERTIPRLTALRRAGHGRAALEVDGEAWRTVPDEVVVRTGLRPGRELDRPLLRQLRRELRRAEALGKAGRVLAQRDVSEATLRTRLERGGVAPEHVVATAETLKRVGALDDERFARNRARALAERGWGNEAILLRLEAEGAPSGAACEAVGALEPEVGRAQRLVTGLAPRKAASLLIRRGFDPGTVEDVIPILDAEAGAELR